MKRLVLFAILALVPLAGDAQVRVDRYPLMVAFDLDGEAADDDQIVAVATLADSTTFTIAAQPDSCRLVDITVTDADSSISAGTVTVTGLDCLGYGLTASYTLAAGGTGVKTLTVTSGSGTGAYFSSITSVVSSALTGEGGVGDTLKVGYTSNSVNGWAVYGRTRPTGPNGEHGVDVSGYFEINKRITTSGALSTTVTDVVGAEDAFELVSVGDLLQFNLSGTAYERKVTAKASADSITINSAVNIPAAGMAFRFKKAYFSTNPADDLSFSVAGYKSLNLQWSVDANANTGGVVTLFECTVFGPEYLNAQWVALSTTTTASGAAQVPTTETVNIEALGYNRCRFGVSFGTGDDGDGSPEDINATATLTR